MIKYGILLFAASVCVTAACNSSYAPVCGNDGNTYPNECALKREQLNKVELKVNFQGPCDGKPCNCSDEVYIPACGSDGVTYPNICVFNCSRNYFPKTEPVSLGRCVDSPIAVNNSQKQNKTQFTCDCTDDYTPVCGSDNKTYPNRCALNCARNELPDLIIEKAGECNKQKKTNSTLEPCLCTFNYKPVCGSDNNTYPNECALTCKQRKDSTLQMKHEGQCRSAVPHSRKVREVILQRQPLCPCARNIREVCGTDGNTYSNPCLLECSGKMDSTLTLAHEGPCDGDINDIPAPSQSSCSCEGEAAPVCGHDHVTYYNECTMKCAGQDKKWDGPCAGRVRRRTIYDPSDDCNPNLGMPINIFRCKNKWF